MAGAVRRLSVFLSPQAHPRTRQSVFRALRLPQQDVRLVSQPAPQIILKYIL